MSKFKIDGIELHYETRGDKGEVLIFLNGIAMSTSHWNPVVNQLKEKYQILLHDFRGQLLSGKPEEKYTLERHADDLNALMDETGFSSAHIIGTSYGSEVGMVFALRFPDRCKSLTIIDGVSELDPVLESAVDSWKSAALIDARLFYKTLIPWNYSPGYLKKNIKSLREREESIAALPAEYFRAFAALCDAFLEINLTPFIHSIKCPVLILVGEFDILKHKGFANIIRNEIPRSQLEIISGAGHAVVIENPSITAGFIENFVSKQKVSK